MKINILPAVVGATVLCVLLSNAVSAQYFSYNEKYAEPRVVIEAGPFAGAMNAITEVGGNRKSGNRMLQYVTLYNTKLYGGAYVAATYNDHFSGRLQFSFGALEGADSLVANVQTGNAARKAARNLSYKTSISEVSLMFEWHPDMLWRDPKLPPALLSPYLLCGIGYLRFNPTAKYGNNWVQLKPLRLEGQGFAEYPEREIYSGNAISFPLGAGVRYELGPHFYVRAEAALHFTNTDYLDDVSNSAYVDPSLFYKYLPQKQAELASVLYNRSAGNNTEYLQEPGARRGNPNIKDLFWTVGLHAGVVLNRKRL